MNQLNLLLLCPVESNPYTVYDRNVKCDRILSKSCALDFEVFREIHKILFEKYCLIREW